MRSAILAAVAALGLASAAQAGAIILPDGYAGTEGPGNTIIADPRLTTHVQYQFSSSLFSGVTTFDGVAFRFDDEVSNSGALEALSRFDSALKIQLGTATSDMADRSATFANNLGSDAVTVLSGPNDQDAEIGTGEARSFTIVFDFTTPFTYDPSQGDLVLDLFLPPTNFTFLTVDTVIGNSTLGALYALGSGATGRGIGAVAVTEFLTEPTPPPGSGHGDDTGPGAVPEPATWTLTILGFGGAGAMLRRRRPALATA
jgi:PEP-CTERM motif